MATVLAYHGNYIKGSNGASLKSKKKIIHVAHFISTLPQFNNKDKGPGQ
jgi:hypothetical protein